jgi:hypothetical protein
MAMREEKKIESDETTNSCYCAICPGCAAPVTSLCPPTVLSDKIEQGTDRSNDDVVSKTVFHYRDRADGERAHDWNGGHRRSASGASIARP